MRTHVVVIGAGVFGAWTATIFFCSGHQVTLIDAWGPAHSRASSGGESRLTRGAYGKDEIYTRMALDSLAEWKALSAASGLPIFTECGVLFFFPSEEPYFRDSVAAHAQLGLPTEVLTNAEMARRFPMIDFDGIGVGLFEPRFGALMARRAVQTLVEKFVAKAASIVGRRGRAGRAPRRSAKSSSQRRGSAPTASSSPRPLAAEAIPRCDRRANRRDPAGGLLLRPAGRRPHVRARRDAVLGRLQPGRHVLRLSRSREPRLQVRARPAWARDRSRHARTGARPKPRSPRSSPSATGASRCFAAAADRGPGLPI